MKENTASAAPEDERSGVRMRWVNIVMISVACALACLMFLMVNRSQRGYRDLQQNTLRYIELQQDAADLQAGSDYLTEQVRCFVVTGDEEHVANFFREIEETRRRDNALEELQIYLDDTETYAYLREALNISNELVEREYYAIRLAAEGFGAALSALPEPVRQVTLSAGDTALSARAQIALAQEMVFGAEYRSYKDRISRNVSLCTEQLIEQSRRDQQTSADRMLLLLRLQEGLLVLIVACMIGFVIQTRRLIIKPLMSYVSKIRNQKLLPMKGAYELQYLARTYNHIFEQTQEYQDKLSYEASHDPLTGLYNRSLFESMRETIDQKNCAFILIDLDDFKTVNDSYGHDVGDQVLKKAASLLQASFRSEDYVCRIGGDEFAVIMVHASSALRELVAGKIERLNALICNPTDGLPPFSVSAGVAFGDRENPTDDIYKDADAALYRTKENGRCGYSFY